MSNLAIIPARGGSKRIPRKNIRPFLGKPIVAYPIQAAIQSGLFDEVMVSTDDVEIAEIAKSYGAKVPFLRSKNTSDDYSPLSDVIQEVANMYLSKGKQFDFLCTILPTAALLKKEFILKSFEIIKNCSYDVVMPVVSFSYPIQRALVERSGMLEYREPMFQVARSQDLERCFYDAGMFYWRKFGNWSSNNRYGYEISEIESQDIDNETDWILAEIKYSIINRDLE